MLCKTIRKYIFTLILICLSNSITAGDNIIIWRSYKDLIVLDRYSLQKIFTRRITRWPDGRNIVVYTKPLRSIEHKSFVNNVLQIRPFYYQQMLDQQVYSGKVDSVIEVNNDDQMLMKILNTPGSIGYINYDLYIEDKKVMVVDTNTIDSIDKL